ncbi:MAG: response regulator [Acidobacteria bacterium]|nr:response regulator [Acidobacteriota bacterium]
MTIETGHPVRLLVVDDDARFVEYLRILLRRARSAFDVSAVGTVDEALRGLARGTHDVCLLDYRLGDEDGLDVLRRARVRDLATPVVLLTGEQDESLELAAIHEGAQDYLNKSELEPHRLERTLLRAIARHRAERTLRERELRVAEAEARALVMATLVGLDGRWLKVPPRFCALLGYTEEELLGLRFQDITHPDDLACCVDALQQMTAGTVRSVECEKRYVRKDGGTVWVYLNSSLVADDDGTPLCLLTYVRDIGEQKQLEEQLRQAHKMQAIGQLAGGVAHDFNNLLTAILGYAQLLEEECAGIPDAERDVAEVLKAATSASALTAQLLAFSRKQLLKPEVLSVNTVIEGMTNLLSRVVGEDITIVTRLGEAVPLVEADLVQLQQMLINLASNARDAMPRGGRLVVETSTRVMADAGGPLPPGTYASIVVSDTGCGMDRATLARIFEPFFTTKEHGKGTGLGLSTVYGIVKQSGGDIACESAPGAGATFSILLPASEKASPVPSIRGTMPCACPGTILLVEDRTDVRLLARRILVRCGYTVLDTDDPDIALRTADETSVDLLLTDVVMPGMNGPELARRLRARHPDVRVMFMSGFAEHSAIAETGGAPFLSKPFTPEVLLQKVHDALGETDAQVTP